MSEPLTGLRLIAPGEPDVIRYMDNVVKITYTTLREPDDLFSTLKKVLCAGSAIICIYGKNKHRAIFGI